MKRIFINFIIVTQISNKEGMVTIMKHFNSFFINNTNNLDSLQNEQNCLFFLFFLTECL